MARFLLCLVVASLAHASFFFRLPPLVTISPLVGFVVEPHTGPFDNYGTPRLVLLRTRSTFLLNNLNNHPLEVSFFRF